MAGVAATPLTSSVTETDASGCMSAPGGAAVTVLPAGQAIGFYTLTPCRTLNTRNTPDGPLSGPALQPHAVRTFDVVASSCGIPSGARAISINVTAVQGTAPGNLVVYPLDGLQPTISAISYAAGKTRGRNAILSLAADGSGTIKVYANTSGTVHFILDVNGYFQ